MNSSNSSCSGVVIISCVNCWLTKWICYMSDLNVTTKHKWNLSSFFTHQGYHSCRIFWTLTLISLTNLSIDSRNWVMWFIFFFSTTFLLNIEKVKMFYVKYNLNENYENIIIFEKWKVLSSWLLFAWSIKVYIKNCNYSKSEMYFHPGSCLHGSIIWSKIKNRPFKKGGF